MPPAVFNMLEWFCEWFWNPEHGWHARHEVDASQQQVPEDHATRIDPQTALCFLLLKEARTDGKPEVILHDRDLLEEQKQKRESKSMCRCCCCHFSGGLIRC